MNKKVQEKFDSIGTKGLRDIYLVLITLFLFYSMFQLVAPFATTLLIALLLVALFQPMYKKIEKYTTTNIAAIFSTVIVLLIVVIPSVIIVSLVLDEIINQVDFFVNNEMFDSQGNFILIDKINIYLQKISPRLRIENVEVDVKTEDFQNTLLSFAGGAKDVTIGVLNFTGNFFIQFIVFIFSIALIFKDYEKLPKIVQTYVPLSNDLEITLLQEFLDAGKGLIKGIILVSLVHAFINSAIFWIFGIEGLGIIFALIFVASMFPGGSQIIWIPTGIIYGLQNGWGYGILILILCFISMNLIDTIIRPALSRGGSKKLHPLLSLISLLGGLVLYGFSGLLYGPLIAVLFITIINAYNKRFKNLNKDTKT